MNILMMTNTYKPHRGVVTPITAIPTGIRQEQFRQGDGIAARRRFEIPHQAWVVGHVGR
jgi:hypothetical protein